MNHFVVDFDRTALSLGFIELRWYALAYIVGFLLVAWWMRKVAKKFSDEITSDNVSDFLSWAIIGVIIGGRLGYVLFYNPLFFLANPLEIVMVWHGGMSFHGGFLGALGAMYFYCKRHGIAPLAMGDLMACAAPIGLFLGRVANFINGELWGHPSDVAWAMIFPYADNLPRHPSQLYEAVLEGLVIFAVANVLAWRGGLARRGLLSGVFLALYGIFRIVVEEFRVSDPVPESLQAVLVFGSWGQWLSVPMVVIGGAIIMAVCLFRLGAKK